MRKYSCIIPLFNEGPRISNVLSVISRVKEISETICVDDGSTDNSTDIIQDHFPKVILIKHKVNQGKTNAIYTGVKLAKNDSVLLLDSDLIDLSVDEISNAFASFEHNQLDCLLLNTAPINSLDAGLRIIFRFLLLAAGNRIIHKDHLIAVLSSGSYKSYHLEIAQNKYLMEHQKKVAYFDISAKDVSKIAKVGIARGTKDELEMWRQIISFAGLGFFLKQTLFFARRKVS